MQSSHSGSLNSEEGVDHCNGTDEQSASWFALILIHLPLYVYIFTS